MQRDKDKSDRSPQWTRQVRGQWNNMQEQQQRRDTAQQPPPGKWRRSEDTYAAADPHHKTLWEMLMVPDRTHSPQSNEEYRQMVNTQININFLIISELLG